MKFILAVGLCTSAMLGIARAELGIGYEVTDGLVLLSGTEGSHLLVKGARRDSEAEVNTGWRLFGDIKAEADFIEWRPDFTIERVPNFRRRSPKEAAFVAVVRCVHETRNDTKGKPRQSEFLTYWPNGSTKQSVAIVGWLVSGEVRHLSLQAIPSSAEISNFSIAKTFQLSEEELRGQPVLLLWSEGKFVRPATFLTDPEKSKWAVAAMIDDVDTVKAALSAGNRLDFRDPDGLTLLHYAAKTGSLKAATRLIEAYPKLVDAQDNFGRTPLLEAARLGRLDVVEVLLNARAKVNLASNNGTTPLLAATARGHLAVAQRLVERHAEVDAYDEFNHSPLGFAIDNGYADLASMLLKAHAQFTTGAQACRVLISKAAENDVEMVRWLIARNVDTGMVDHQQTALMAGALRGTPSLVEVLVREGRANPNQRNESGQTALMRAALTGNLDYMSSLLSAGASVDSALPDGSTALHNAAAGDKAEAVALLLNHGASPLTKNKHGLSPLDIAILSRSLRAAEELESRGASIDLQAAVAPAVLEAAVACDHAGALKPLVALGWNGKMPLTNGLSPLQVATICQATRVLDLLAKIPGIEKPDTGLPLAKAHELDTPPKLIAAMQPEDPRGLFESFGATEIDVLCVIDGNGKALFPRFPHESDSRLRAAILSVLSYWRFTPAKRQGTPVMTDVIIPIEFPPSAERAFNGELVDHIPQIISQPVPIYPQSLRRSRVPGRVVVRFLVTSEGTVRNPIILETSHPDFSDVAIATILKWKFKPGTLDSKPVPVWMTVPISFSIR